MPWNVNKINRSGSTKKTKDNCYSSLTLFRVHNNNLCNRDLQTTIILFIRNTSSSKTDWSLSEQPLRARRVSSLMNTLEVLCLREISINVNKLFIVIFVYVVLAVLLLNVYLFILFFILMLLLHFCLFIDHVNKSIIFVFGVFVYYFGNTITLFKGFFCFLWWEISFATKNIVFIINNI